MSNTLLTLTLTKGELSQLLADKYIANKYRFLRQQLEELYKQYDVTDDDLYNAMLIGNTGKGAQ